jgi:hypothetical protein
MTDDIVTEELDLGSAELTITEPTTTEEEDTGLASVNYKIQTAPPSVPGGDTVSGGVVTSEMLDSGYVAPAKAENVTLEQLDVVYAAFGDRCSSVSAIVSSTGLSNEVVVACLNLLKKMGTIGQDKAIFCPASGVQRLVEQLKSCAK